MIFRLVMFNLSGYSRACIRVVKDKNRSVRLGGVIYQFLQMDLSILFSKIRLSWNEFNLVSFLLMKQTFPI